MIQTAIRLTRVESGMYRYEGARYSCQIQRIVSAYGDVQWVIDAVDRDRDMTEYHQTDTLAGARATIAHMEQEVSE